jgi:hypothetical protein
MAPSRVISPTQLRMDGTGETPAVHPKGHPGKLPDGLFGLSRQWRRGRTEVIRDHKERRSSELAFGIAIGADGIAKITESGLLLLGAGWPIR